MLARLVLALLLGGLGCRHAPRVERTLSFPSTLEISAVAIDPTALRWDSSSYRSLELSQRMVDEAVRRQGDSLLIFGSWEAVAFGELLPRSQQSPVIALLIPHGVPPERLVIFKPWLEQRIQSGATSVQDSAGKSAGKARSEVITYIAHLDVVAASNNEVVAELKGEVDIDPFAESEDEGDSAPALTRLMEALVADALLALKAQHRLPAAPPRPFNGKLLYAPQQGFDFILSADKPPLRAQLLKGDALDQEVVERRAILFANPGIDEALVAKLSRSRGGLYVQRGDGELGLHAGDLILQIDRRPASRQAFHRALLYPAPTELLVQRANGEETVVVLK